jgi:hypothetical protein
MISIKFGKKRKEKRTYHMETSSVMTFKEQVFQHRGITVEIENDVLVFSEQRIKGLHIRSINEKNQREKIE